jgi:CheY-like chemotaxis protein
VNDKQILVVDGSAEARLSLELLLRMSGYHVATAADGGEALDYLRAHEPPDMVFCDLRAAGADAIRAISGLGVGDPVVALSAAPVMLAEAHALGAVAVLNKPVTRSALLQAVGDLSREGGLAAASD